MTMNTGMLNGPMQTTYFSELFDRTNPTSLHSFNEEFPAVSNGASRIPIAVTAELQMGVEAKQSSQKCTENPEIAPIPSQGDRSTQMLFHHVKDCPEGFHLVPHSSANAIARWCKMTINIGMLNGPMQTTYRVVQSFLPKSICLLHMNQWANPLVLYIKMKRMVCMVCNFDVLKAKHHTFHTGKTVRFQKVPAFLGCLLLVKN